MKKLIAALASAIAFAATCTAPASSAGTIPTITGPDVVRYYAKVQLTGTTPDPNQQLVVYAKWASQSTFTIFRKMTSNSSGEFSTDYLATGTRSYYVSAGGLNSRVRTTTLSPLQCAVTRPAFRRLPFRDAKSDPSPGDFAAFTDTRDGMWAGYAVNGFGIRSAVITWRRGDPGPTVLQRFRERYRIRLLGAEKGDIDIAGITPLGAVVAAIRNGAGFLQRTGYVWLHGNTHRLASRRTWTSVYPEEVTERGRIIGWVRTVTNGAPSFYLVEWPRWNERPHVLLQIPRQSRTHLYIDGLGDVAFPRNGGTTVLLHGDGTTRRVVSDTYDYIGVMGSGGPYLYGSDGNRGLLRWDLTTPPSSGPIIATKRVGEVAPVTAANARGDFVSDHRVSLRQSFVTASGGHVLTPPQVRYDDWAGQAVGERGALAFTAAFDGLPHFLRCHAA